MENPDVILYKLNYFKPAIDRASKLTERYIAIRRLLLIGGKAIDLALRQRDRRIYDDNAFANYHVLSDKHLLHASALAKILCHQGLPDINIISAIHANTVRVQMKNIVLIDVTYVPTNLYVQIPYLDTGDLRTIHPHYQFIDQRASLSTLMVDAGDSLSVFHRLIKDISRNLLLREMYPIRASSAKPTTTTLTVPLDLIRLDESKIDQINEHCFFYTGKACLAGAVAAAVVMNTYKLTDDALIVQVHEGLPVRILTCDMESWQFVNPKTYRPLLQLKPATILDGNYEYVDTYGKRIGCYVLELTSNLPSNKSVKVCVASVDYLLMELLRDRVFVKEEPSTTLYTQLVAKVDEKRKQSDSEAFWWPSLNSYGRIDLSKTMVLTMEKIVEPSATNLLPKNVYLSSKCVETIDSTDEGNSHYFKLDGKEDSNHTHTNDKYIQDQYLELLRKQRKKMVTTALNS
jgi:hypothetical protein